MSLPGAPFGVVTTANGAWSFVAVMSGRTSGLIVVLSDRSSPPVVVHQVPVNAGPVGEFLTHDGRYLLVASGSGALVLSVSALETGSLSPLVGTLTSTGADAIEVAASTDDRYAFVTLEGSQEMAVFNLAMALRQGFGAQDVVGMVPLGEAPVGIAVSPDGRSLYVTSESERNTHLSIVPGTGTLSVVDVSKAESDPAASVVATVQAGCSPVRVVTTQDGRTVWVTARGSDALLGFSASSLVSDPSHAQVANVPVGEAPVGVALVNHDTTAVVADSNRFATHGAASDLAIVDLRAALAGRSALLGYIPAGLFPREMAAVGNTLLVTNYGSNKVEAVNLSSLPPVGS